MFPGYPGSTDPKFPVVLAWNCHVGMFPDGSADPPAHPGASSQTASPKNKSHSQRYPAFWKSPKFPAWNDPLWKAPGGNTCSLIQQENTLGMFESSCKSAF